MSGEREGPGGVGQVEGRGGDDFVESGEGEGDGATGRLREAAGQVGVRAR